MKVKELYPTLEWEERDVQQLDACYIPSRYPGPIEKEFSSKDSTSALEIAERLLNKARTV